MQTLGGIVFALIVAAVTGFFIIEATQAVTQKFESHIPARAENIEAPARYLGSRHADAGRGNLVGLHRQISSRLLSSGSDGSF